MEQASVKLSGYSPDWPSKFEAEKTFLLDLVGSYNHGSIEHVGSTSVPGLIAKPVIDIMFGVKSLEESKSAIGILANNGYCYFPY
ncbi:MAG: GrpB family protein [Amphritea sp.]